MITDDSKLMGSASHNLERECDLGYQVPHHAIWYGSL
jgi:hypothetical protein